MSVEKGDDEVCLSGCSGGMKRGAVVTADASDVDEEVLVELEKGLGDVPAVVVAGLDHGAGGFTGGKSHWVIGVGGRGTVVGIWVGETRIGGVGIELGVVRSVRGIGIAVVRGVR